MSGRCEDSSTRVVSSEAVIGRRIIAMQAVLTLLCCYFSAHLRSTLLDLPCRAIIFLRTYGVLRTAG